MEMDNPVILKGPKVWLTNNLEEKYAEEMARMANDKEIYRNLGAHTFPSPYRKEDAINFFTMNRKDGKNYFTMDFLIFAGDKLAGVIGLKDINYIDRNAHIGYWIGKEHRNKGFASEAVSLLSSFCREELKLVMIYTGVLDYNLASVKVLMKNGFSVDGFRKKVFLMDDGFHSFFYLSRILD